MDEISAKSGSDRKGKTVERLREALQRVLNGVATRVGPGHRLSVSAVCVEAGLTRTAVYKHHPDILEEIQRALKSAKAPKVSRSRRRELEVRAENEELHRRVAALLSQNATLLHRATEAERRMDAMRQRGAVRNLTDVSARERPERSVG